VRRGGSRGPVGKHRAARCGRPAGSGKATGERAGAGESEKGIKEGAQVVKLRKGKKEAWKSGR